MSSLVVGLLLYLAVNTAITVATRSAMRAKGVEPARGETMFVVVGLLSGVLVFVVAFVAAVRRAMQEAKRP